LLVLFPQLCAGAEPAVWIDGKEGEVLGKGNARPMLVLDTGGHSGTICRVIPTRDGKEVVTVSYDKTIRIWDVQSGECQRTLRPQIGPGPEGSILTAALSPDGKWLAASILPARDVVGNPIHLIDLDKGQVERVIRTGHLDSVISLDFSPDGNK